MVNKHAAASILPTIRGAVSLLYVPDPVAAHMYSETEGK